MSIARDDAGNIRELLKTALGLSRNFRDGDASGGTGGTRMCVCVNSMSYQCSAYSWMPSDSWEKDPMPIHTPGRVRLS